MNESQTLSLDQLKSKMEQIIKKEVPLRDPAIVVIHCPKEVYQSYTSTLLSIMRQFKDHYSEWNYNIVNLEKLLFSLLGETGYVDNENFALKCSREELKKQIKRNILKDFLQKIEEGITILKSSHISKPTAPPPFLILLNIHSCYHNIETKDVVGRIINQKGVYVLIFYLQQYEKNNFYKEANYNVESIFLSE